ncbi:MAG TPA: phosphonopyruvate decarboxylase [Spirochaetota bacterium]|nr:phosphonopyruvate decarboxylase [Spirochaetota bacterium]
MKVDKLLGFAEDLGIDFFTGVPDSQLKALCDTLFDRFKSSDNHIVAANEGAAVALASGHYLATGKPALVYMQNSGIGNAVNPVCSLTNDKVYAIPMLFVVGWRGKPGVHDEPQHVFQGEITVKLLELLEIKTFILTKETSDSDFETIGNEIKKVLASGKSAAIVVEKDALQTDVKPDFNNSFSMTREEALGVIIEKSEDSDIFVSTTGKMSRELFETRERLNQGHSKDFLTVGSMGHSVMIAAAISLNKKNRRVFCLDGDGALLMHGGSLAVNGTLACPNMVHIVINNRAHESVGGMPTAAAHIDLVAMALSCGYKKSFRAENEEELSAILNKINKTEGPVFVEVNTNIKSRKELGRPTTTPVQNRDAFMNFLK